MISYSYIDDYINQWRNDEIILNKERILLIEWLEQDILTMDNIYFDEEQIENFIKFSAKWYFELQPFQKFLACFIFLRYKEDDSLVFDEFFYYMARGAGKNGFISALSNFLISELHGIPFYGVSIVANSQDQAEMSFKEVYNAIDLNEELQDYFIHKKSMIECIETKAEFHFHTSNAKTKDGGRQGVIIYDEVHEFDNSEIVDVFSGGLGKVKDSREFFISTDGFVRSGFIDRLKERAMNILKREVSVDEDSLFPFMCCIDDESEMNNKEMWQKANPMLHYPMSDYAKTLLKKITKQYNKLQNDSSGYENFITKRMNLPKVDMEKSVTSWEKIEATNQPYQLADFKNRECIGTVDYASIRDFAATGLLFVEGDKFIMPKELTQSFACKPFVDKHYAYSGVKSEGNNKKENRKFAPIREWEEQGLITILHKDTMDPHLIVKWFVDKRKEGYLIKKIVGDNFRMELLKPLFEAEAFEVEVIRNPDAASALLSPKIELAFDKENVIFGDNPMMRWYTNNVLVIIDNKGNKLYRKKEPVKRKTDGFMAFLYGVWAARDLNNTGSGGFKALAALRF
ncbi:terminase large subunit domain-containing protein [Solibacillus isronensis]|uniref:terminase large subunit domain-containing protein n=1 Tax=Solibacillus isronensis TaxID=412383 RepID=UPI0039A0996A